MKKICILDYGLGNIKSLHNSLKKIGYKPNFYSEDKSSLYDVLFIPGVGSFNTAIKLLKEKNYFNLINNFNNQNTFIFGICLGMQLLLSIGYEDKKNEGLNLIKGEAVKIDQEFPIPIIGWNKVFINSNNKFTFLKKYNSEMFYFIHSYHAKLKNIEIDFICKTLIKLTKNDK